MELPTMPDLIELNADEMAAVNGGADSMPVVDIFSDFLHWIGLPGACLPPATTVSNMC
jgi:hypothetical protein